MASIASPFAGGFVPPGSPGSPEAAGGPAQPGGEPQSSPGMEGMLGGQGIPAPDPQEHLRAIMNQYRQVELQYVRAEQAIDGLAAASGPETAPMARVIKQATGVIKESIRKMMAKAAERPGAVPEPAAPRTMA